MLFFTLLFPLGSTVKQAKMQGPSRNEMSIIMWRKVVRERHLHGMFDVVYQYHVRKSDVQMGKNFVTGIRGPATYGSANHAQRETPVPIS